MSASHRLSLNWPLLNCHSVSDCSVPVSGDLFVNWNEKDRYFTIAGA
ncbi:hypothetical protein [Pectobacterium parvum]|uniref:Uncharacterized protein n=1 Tax=Pectobacterium parvum TaxID=2778550 RepID=A0AAP9LD20_9GAMM|nr:hypothetical protein [Pectobacterium parvum]QHQ24720.1 hypothetical protein GMX10_12065 [Pectobacterium parvum]UVD98455.1 hypothetical protein NV347_05435 [Pectobacterium parvum]